LFLYLELIIGFTNLGFLRSVLAMNVDENGHVIRWSNEGCSQKIRLGRISRECGLIYKNLVMVMLTLLFMFLLKACPCVE